MTATPTADTTSEKNTPQALQQPSETASAVDTLSAQLTRLFGALEGEEDPAPVRLPISLPTRIALQGEKLPPVVTDGLHPSVAEAHQATRNWCRSILNREQPYWLTLFGSSGCGKTFLARHAKAHLRNKQRTVQLWNWSIAFDRILSEPDFLAHLCRLPVLILDDIGTGYTLSEKAAELHSAKLYEILESRLNLPTLITTNLSPQNLRERLDSRIASRLFRGLNQIVDLTQADDYSYIQYLRNRKKP